MYPRKTFLVLLMAGAIAISAAGQESDFSYCNVPLDLPENSLTSQMTLTQLQVVIRHGDRVPTTKLPIGTVPWVCDVFAHTLRYLDVSPQAVNQVIDGPFSFPPSCANGQLTVTGRDQQLALGAVMRKKYVERLGFLPPALTPSNQAQFLFRSTDVPRTRQSGQAFLVGLYPGPSRIGNPTLALDLRDLDNISPNPILCPKLSILGPEYLNSPLFAEVVKNNLDAARETGEKIGTWHVGTDPKTREAEEVASFLETIGASDNLFGRYCHGKEMPEGVGLEDVENMRVASDQAMAGNYTFTFPNPEATRLTIGNFLGDIRNAMIRAARQEPAPRMALYSGHDVTVWPLLAALSQDNAVEVPFASHMAFELWQDDDGESYVAVDFNGTYLKVGDCPSTLCKLEVFEAAIERFVPVDYERECQVSEKTTQVVDLLQLFN